MSFAEIKIKYWPKSLEDKRKTPIFALINKDKMNNGDQVERLPQEGECRNESESSLLARASAVAQGVLKEIEALAGTTSCKSAQLVRPSTVAHENTNQGGWITSIHCCPVTTTR